MTITKCHFSIFCEPAIRICNCCFELVWRKKKCSEGGGREKNYQKLTDD